MASGDGIITRKDIITDEALAFGKEYRKNVDEAIQANKELIDQFKTLLKVSGDYRKAQDSHDFRKAKQEESLLNQKMINELKRLSLVEKELEKIKQEKFKTERELLKVAQENIRLSKLQATQQRSAVKLTMEERVQQQLANKAEKEAVLNKMGLIGAYQKLSAQRTQAKKRLQDLIASEKASNAEIRKAQREFDVLDAKIRKADNAVRDFTKNVGNYKSAFGDLTRELAGIFGWTSAIAGTIMLMRSFKDVIFDFDNGLLNISKTTGLTDDELKNLGISVRLLSQELKVVPIEKLLEYATVAGQLGVKGSDNIMKFTEALAKLETASNITGEEGGAEIARMLTLIDGGVQNVKDFGDEIVHLGNNFAATEKEILSNSTSIAQNVSVYKTGRQDVLAYGTATKAIGIESELAGSKIGKAMKFLEASIRTGSNINEVMQLTGMSVEELKTKFKEDSGGVLFKFIEGLNKIDKAGGSVIGTLNELGIKEERQERVLSSLATGGFETLRRAMHDVKDASGAMTEEFETASGKLKNEYQSMKISWDNFILSVNSSENAIGNFASKWMIGARTIIDWIGKISTSWAELNKMAGMEAYEAEKFYQSQDYNTNEKRREWAIEDEQRYIKKLKELNKDLQTEQKKLDKWEKDRLLPNFMYLGVNEGEKAKKAINGINTEISITENKIKALNDLYKDWRKKGGDSTVTTVPTNLDESDKDRKKREAAEKRAQREREKALKEADKLEKERLKQEKENYEAGIDLLIWREKNKAEVYKAESVNEKNTQDERYNALIASQKAEEEALRLNYEKQLTLSRAFQTEKDAFTKQEIDDFLTKEELLKGVNTLTDAELLILEKYYAEQKKLRKDNSKDLEDNVKFEAEQLKKRVDEKAKEISYDNDKLAADEIDKLDIGKNLTDVEKYEKAVYDIKRKYLLLSLQQQLDALDEEIKIAQTKGEVDKSILEKQLKLRTEIKEFENKTHVESLEKAKEIEQRFIEMGEAIKNALVDLTNAIFDNRIQRIDEDIERTNDQYEKQIELYEGDKDRQDAIRKEQEAAREKLEAKKRKEQHKQAVFNKAMAIADIGFNTATAIMKAYADLGPVAGTVAAVLVGILGTVQTAAVLATPIPKYKMGRKGGPEEFAIVGDGGVHEVIEHKDGSAEITPKRDTLVKLLEGDTVHSSIDRYRQARRNQFRNDLIKDQIRMDSYLREREMLVDNSNIERKLDELIRITKSKNTSVNVNVPKVDISHELWRLKQLNH